MFEVTDIQKIGIGLTGFGLFFLLLGILFIFDKGLLALGNILFLSGLAFVIGLERTFRFFFQRHKIRGSAAFFGGIFIVLFGWPLVGMIIEVYGFVILFRKFGHAPTSRQFRRKYSGFLPVAVNFLRRVPLIGTILNFPILNKIIDRLAGDANRSIV